MSSDTTKRQAEAGVATDRRGFLKAVTGASAVAATAVVGADPAEAQTTRESREERTKARYQANSPDVQAFYRTNRY